MLTRRSFHAGLSAALSGVLVGAPAQGATGTPPATVATALGAAQAAFATKLLATLMQDHAARGATKGYRTVIVSPMSAALSLSVIGLLGGDAMRRSLRRTLQFQDVTAFDPFETTLTQGRALSEAQRADGSPLITADLLMLDQATEPYRFTLEGLKQQKLDVSVGDLSIGQAVTQANNWVKEHTQGLIPTILDFPPGRGGLVALNALHFKDSWKVPFDIAMSTTAPFHIADGTAVPVRMMTGQGAYLFRQEGPLGAVDLPFRNPRFSLVLVKRTEQPFTAAQLGALNAGWLNGSGFVRRIGEVGLPRLDLTSSADLLPALSKFGFEGAPLTGLGARAPMLRAVSQRTVLKLDETGVEAAAATAAIGSRSLKTSFVKLVFDRPFIFALRDTTSGFIVMAGYVDQLPRFA